MPKKYEPFRFAIPPPQFRVPEAPRIQAPEAPGVAGRPPSTVGGISLSTGALGGGAVVLAAVVALQAIGSVIDGIKATARAFIEDLNFTAIQKSFDGLAGSADRAANLMSAMQRGSSALVSARDLTTLGVKALEAGVAENEEELQKLLRAGHLLGRAVGIGIVESSGKLIESLARGSARTFTQFGVSQAAVRERMEEMAQSVGDTVKGMSAGDRLRSFQRAALDLAAERAEVFATDMVDTSDVTAQFAALLDDIRLRFLTAIARSPEAIAAVSITASLMGDAVTKLEEIGFGGLIDRIKAASKPFMQIARFTLIGQAVELVARRGADRLLQDLDTAIEDAMDGPVRQLEEAWEARNVAIDFWSNALASGYLWIFGDQRSRAEHARMVREGRYTRPRTPSIGDLVRKPLEQMRAVLAAIQWVVTGDPDAEPPNEPEGVRRRGAAGLVAPAQNIMANVANQTMAAGFAQAQRWKGVIEREINPVQQSVDSLAGAFDQLFRELERAAGSETAAGRTIKAVRLGITAFVSFIQAAINLARAIAELLSFQYAQAAAHFIAAAAFATAGSLAIALGGRNMGGRADWTRAQSEAQQALRPASRKVTVVDVRVPGTWHQDNRTLEDDILRRIGAATNG